MNETLYNEVLEEEERTGPVKLPAFLNVLTILTFIGSGLGVVSQLYSLTTVDSQREQIAETRKLLASSPNQPQFLKDMMESSAAMLEHVYPLAISGLLVAIACLFGAYMMRQLKKNGFYLYTIASIAGIVIPISIIGLGLMGGFILAGSIFTVAFIIMYGVNLKYMN